MSEYWWISVGGSECEPAVKDSDGKFYTFGCADPLSEDDFKKVRQIKDIPEKPLSPEEEEKERIRLEKYWEGERKAGRVHGYRKFT